MRTPVAYPGHRTLVCSSLLTSLQSRWAWLQRQCRTSAAAKSRDARGYSRHQRSGAPARRFRRLRAVVAVEQPAGATLCTTDRDFARFPGLSWTNPIASRQAPWVLRTRTRVPRLPATRTQRFGELTRQFFVPRPPGSQAVFRRVGKQTGGPSLKHVGGNRCADGFPLRSRVGVDAWLTSATCQVCRVEHWSPRLECREGTSSLSANSPTSKRSQPEGDPGSCRGCGACMARAAGGRCERRSADPDQWLDSARRVALV